MAIRILGPYKTEYFEELFQERLKTLEVPKGHQHTNTSYTSFVSPHNVNEHFLTAVLEFHEDPWLSVQIKDESDANNTARI